MAGIVAHWAYRSLLAVGIPAKLYLSHRNDRIYAKSVGKRGVPASGVSHFYCHPAAGSGVILIDLVNMLRSACGPASASAGAVPASARWPRRARAVLTRAKKDRKGDSSKSQKSAAPPPEPKLSSAKPREDDFTLNPLTLGRRSREAFDAAWNQFASLGALNRKGSTPMSLEDIDMLDRQGGPNVAGDGRAQRTLVLVIGATGRVGRILVRKLLLRGYRVRALVRKRPDGSERELLPEKVEVVYGDVSDYASVRSAVRAADKVVYCAGARTMLTPDLSNVYLAGVETTLRALFDESNDRKQGALSVKEAQEETVEGLQPKVDAKVLLANFKRQGPAESAWKLQHVGLAPTASQLQRTMYRAQDIASIDFVEDARAAKAAEPALVAAGAAGEDAPGGAAVKRYGRKDGDAADGDAVPAFLRFKGVVYNRGAMAEAGAQVSGGPGTLAGTEAINLHVGGDGQQYLCVVRAGGHSYVQRFLAREGFGNVHLPWCFFRPEVRDAEAPPLDPNDIDYVGIRYEPRIGMAGAVEQGTENRQRFNLYVSRIKVSPTRPETNFVLVSCAGSGKVDMSSEDLQKEKRCRAEGEARARTSGVGYTIIRPGRITEEAGGYKALVFDQGDRVDQAVSAADVADICLRSLHDPEARNRTFEVCFEYPSGNAYELVAHLPDRDNNYLGPALATLERNT